MGVEGGCSLGKDWVWITFIECISEYIRSIFGRIFGVTHSVAGRRSGVRPFAPFFINSY